MKKKFAFTIIIILILLNITQFLWYVNPLSFFTEPYVTNEAMAISIARNFDTKMGGNNEQMIFTSEYIQSNGHWLVVMSPSWPSFGWQFTFVGVC